MQPLHLFKCLGDETRLMLMLVIRQEGELCVCEMTHMLEESQPKVSRHLAQLRGCGLVVDQRVGQWIYYRLAPNLPRWVLEILRAAAEGDRGGVREALARLNAMGNRPERRATLC